MCVCVCDNYPIRQVHPAVKTDKKPDWRRRWGIFLAETPARLEMDKKRNAHMQNAHGGPKTRRSVPIISVLYKSWTVLEKEQSYIGSG